MTLRLYAPGPATNESVPHPSRFLRWVGPAILAIASTAQAQSLPAVPPVAHTAAAQDPLLAAMLTELEREAPLLVLPGTERPYFIEYRLDDFASFEAVANYGALTRREHSHQRVVRVTVRIGDYKQDSSSARGDGSLALAPAEEGQPTTPEALRYALWNATDEAYKSAVRNLAAKQAALKRFEQAPVAEDFARATPTQHLEPPVHLSIDEDAWSRRIAEASGLYLTDSSVAAVRPAVQYSTATARGIAVNRFLVNTEGTVLRTGYTGYADSFSVGGQAADGMRLGRENGATAAAASELDSPEAFRNRVLTDIRSYTDLRNAPLVPADDFHGPVLFSGDAAADTLQRLFASNVEAERPDLGTTNRTTGLYRSSLHARVLPEGFSVIDNPLERTLAGRTLMGAYQVDDEGVPAQPITLVDNGKLEHYLLGRTPIRDVSTSDGHGRAAPGQPAHSRIGVLTLTAAHPVPNDELHTRLVALAKEQGRDVYEVETMTGPNPRLLFQVHPDGTRTLVRGAAFDELDIRSLRSEILAAGNTPWIDNILGAVPATIVTPPLLFGDIGVKRATEQQEKLPYYPSPTADR